MLVFSLRLSARENVMPLLIIEETHPCDDLLYYTDTASDIDSSVISMCQ